jgi:hypothetical protein
MTRTEHYALSNSIVARALGDADVSAPVRARMVRETFRILYFEAPKPDVDALVAEYDGWRETFASIVRADAEVRLS